MVFADFVSCVACHMGGLWVLRNAANLGKFSALYTRLLEVFSCFGIVLSTFQLNTLSFKLLFPSRQHRDTWLYDVA